MRETWRVRFNGSINHEEDLPAEQPPPSHEARLPRPHAHPRRPRHHQSSSFQGPQDPLRLIPSDGEVERLKSHREFVAVLRHRRRVSSHDIVLHYRMRAAGERAHGNVGSDVRVGLAVSRQWATRSRATRSNAAFACSPGGTNMSCPGNATSYCAPSRVRRARSSRHSTRRWRSCSARCIRRRISRQANRDITCRAGDGSLHPLVPTADFGEYPALMSLLPLMFQLRAPGHRPVRAFRGGLLAALRLLRCRPWSAGGIDDVPQRFSLFYRFSWSRAHEEPRLTPLPHDEKE